MPYPLPNMPPPAMGQGNPANAQQLQAAGMLPPGAVVPGPPQGGPPQGMTPMGAMQPAPAFDFFNKRAPTPDQQAEVARKLVEALKKRK